MNLKLCFVAAATAFAFVGCSSVSCNRETRTTVTLAALLDEMISRDAVTRFPAVPYTSKQVSSYDRRSVSPDADGWFANDDGAGYERLDIVDGRVEKVLFEADGPGVVTRIWMTTKEKYGTLRFYFDGSAEPQLVIPAYDMRRFPVDIPVGLSLTHTHYADDMGGVGGNTFFLPIPYAESCRITFEEPDMSVKIPRYYHVNYRTYPAGTKVRTFSVEEAESLAAEIARVSDALMHPSDCTDGRRTDVAAVAEHGKSVSAEIEGGGAVRHLEIAVSGCDAEQFSDVMEALRVVCFFDGRECVNVPLSDFSGGGTGAPAVDGWYIFSDGRGRIKSRWVMPFRKSAAVSIVNEWSSPVEIALHVVAGDYRWDDRSLYFHCSHRAENGIPLNNNYDTNDNLDWTFADIRGRGIYCGDALSLYNHAVDWYGEGDEKIWVDDDTFPSHFGTGTEDYFNCSWAPVVPFLTPYGGAPRADEASSHGYNAFMRTRNLDVIPFCERLRFDIEMLSWHVGTADYRATSWWYGDADAFVGR